MRHIGSQGVAYGNEEVAMRMAVANISQPLISVGQMVNQGNKVVLSPKVSYLETKSGGIHRIFQRNGVLCSTSMDRLCKGVKEVQPFQRAGPQLPVRPNSKQRTESCFSSGPASGVQSRVGSSPQEPIGHTAPLDGEAEVDDDFFEDWIFGDLEDGQPVVEPEEGRKAKPIRAPCLPSPEEIEAHAVSHIRSGHGVRTAYEDVERAMPIVGS